MRFASRKNHGFRLITVFALCLVFTGVQTARANTSKLTFTNIDVPQATQSGHAMANESNLTVGNFQTIDFQSNGVTAAATGTFGVNDNGDIVGTYIAPNSPQCRSFELSGSQFN